MKKLRSMRRLVETRACLSSQELARILSAVPRRKLVHVGGWGPVLADEGSGVWIGKQAVRAIFDALDHDETTLSCSREYSTSGICRI